MELKITRKCVDSDGVTHKGWAIFCPACRCGHLFDDRWTFNGNESKPSFTPSMLVRGYLGRDENGVEAYGTCHSFVTDGMIAYCADSTHALSGKTVALEPF